MGATVELALNYIAHQGLAQEEEVPYIGLDNFCKKRLGYRDGGWLQLGGHNDGSGDSESLESLTQPGVHEVPSHSPGRHLGMHGWGRLAENGYEELLRTVYETGPVAVSVAAQPWQNYMSGVFDGCRPNDVLDHAVVLVGFGKDHHSGALFYLIQNSWGKDWGEHGNIRLLRHEDDEEHCGWDHRPLEGTGCEGGPRKVKICGMCGVLYDSTVPHFRR
uniref:Peptidase C1A papain C-terminal domain-containing protein n=1 Tax=Pyrodinium bahamense TaxID=73915 RepID=A0A7S0AFG9_9DINO|mmetsp:Transcript_32789/g.90569  ORF Transcript_32789/g.90569 Transcript_32789/m.90569 type:complete len:218 (+) Transcript_32789:1-654(+)